jgi:hypothetical protein
MRRALHQMAINRGQFGEFGAMLGEPTKRRHPFFTRARVNWNTASANHCWHHVSTDLGDKHE